MYNFNPDIIPTILSLLGSNHKHQSWGKNLLSNDNLYNFAVIEKWFEYFLKLRNAKIYMSPIIEPNYLSLNALPNEIKEEKIKWLSNIDHEYAKEAISMFNEHQFDKILLDKFQKFTIKKDKLYMTKIQNLDPIFTRLMEWKI